MPLSELVKFGSTGHVHFKPTTSKCIIVKEQNEKEAESIIKGKKTMVEVRKIVEKNPNLGNSFKSP